MNVIIVIRAGIPDTPILVKETVTAEATFDTIAEKLIDDESTWEEAPLDYGYKLNFVNEQLFNHGIDIHWYEDVEVNEYINEEE